MGTGKMSSGHIDISISMEEYILNLMLYYNLGISSFKHFKDGEKKYSPPFDKTNSPRSRDLFGRSGCVPIIDLVPCPMIGSNPELSTGKSLLFAQTTVKTQQYGIGRAKREMKTYIFGGRKIHF